MQRAFAGPGEAWGGTGFDRHNHALRFSLWPLATIVILVLFAPLLSVPLVSDEGEYAYAARVLLEGGLPYRDTFLQKPPGIVLVYAVLMALGATSPTAFHAAAVAAYVVTALALGWVAARLAGPTAAGGAIILFGASIASPMYQSQAANTEAFLIASVALAVVAVAQLREARTAGWATLAGLAFGIACFMKQPAIFHGAFLAATVVALGRSGTERGWWLTLFLTAAAFPYALALTWYALAGALPEFLDAVLWHNLEYVRRPVPGLPAAWNARPIDIALLAAAPAGALALALSRRWWAAWVSGAWLLTAWCGAATGGTLFGHYLVQVVPAAVLSAALGASTLRPRMAAVTVGAALALYVWSAPWPFGKSSEWLLLERYGVRRFSNAVLLAEEVRNRRPGPVLLLGSEPQVLHYSDRRSVTRYVIMNPLYGGYASSAKRRAEVAAAVERTPPVLVVVASRPPHDDPTLYAQVRSRLDTDYRLVACTHRDTVALFQAVPACAAGWDTLDLVLYERE